MKNPMEYASLIVRTFIDKDSYPNGRQIGQMFIVCEYLGPNMYESWYKLEIYVLRKGIIVKEIDFVHTNDRVCVYSCNYRGGTISGWLYDGKWQDDFYRLMDILEKKLEVEKKETQERIQHDKTIREQILDSYIPFEVSVKYLLLDRVKS